MLAYIFWHSPQAGVDPAAYEGALLRFHQSLDPTEIDGFHDSAIFRIEGVPWMTGSMVYEDWYLITDFTALERLNVAAVTGHRHPPHEAVALLAGQGTAGVYALRHGLEMISDARLAAWFPRPTGTPSDQVVRVAGRGQLWQRQLVLGPTPELCLIGGDAPSEAVVLTRTSVS
jgi:hypothetical protein